VEFQSKNYSNFMFSGSSPIKIDPKFSLVVVVDNCTL